MAEESQPNFGDDLKNKDSQDFYELLGCDELNTKEQINAEFKKKALKYHPDKNNEEKQMFQRLQRARDVLCDESKKKSYDSWRNSGLKDFMSFDSWTKVNAQSHLHWAQPPKKKMLSETTATSSSVSTSSDGSTCVSKVCSTGWGGRSALKRKFQNYEI